MSISGLSVAPELYSRVLYNLFFPPGYSYLSASLSYLSKLSAICTAASFEWDDSIVVDSEKARSTDRADVAMGAMTLVEYRMKWYGETEEVAMQKLAGQQEDGETSGDDE